jgi:hypothetical protein
MIKELRNQPYAPKLGAKTKEKKDILTFTLLDSRREDKRLRNQW